MPSASTAILVITPPQLRKNPASGKADSPCCLAFSLRSQWRASAKGPAAAPLLKTLIERFDSIEVRNGAHHVLGALRQTEIGDKIIGVYTSLGGMHSEEEIIADAERALQRLKAG